MENEKVELKKGDNAFVVSGLYLYEGIFISKNFSYSYIEKEDGSVVGYLHDIVFPKKVLALEHLVEVLKKDISYPLKQLVEKLPVKNIEKIGELIKVVNKINKSIAKK